MAALNVVTLAFVFLVLNLSATPIESWRRLRFRFRPNIRKRPRLPVKRPAPKPSSFTPIKDSKYCDESGIAKILSEKERRKRSISWPYDCTYPSIIKYEGRHQFMYDIYSCCKKCDYPTYSSCRVKHNSPNWLCPSDGLHCIVECVKKYGPAPPAPKPKPPKKGWGGFRTAAKTTSPRKKPLKCQKIEKLPNGKTCIRRLCLPLKP